MECLAQLLQVLSCAGREPAPATGAWRLQDTQDAAVIGLWRQRLGDHNGPLYLAIVEVLEHAIRAGELREGARLPPQRALAAGLGVDLTTITRAFTEAKRRGLLDASVGRGSFVRSGTGASRWRDDRQAVIDLTMNLPPVPAEPSLQRMLADGVNRLLRKQDVSVLMSYRLTVGALEERQAGIQWLHPLLGRRPVDEMLLAPGAQSALVAVVSSMLQAGDALVAEQFTYPGIRALAAQLGLVLSGVAMDTEGMRPDGLDRVLRESGARLIYCTPNIQNPTTATMSLQRRTDILEVAARHKAMIVEDDPYGLLPQEPLPALARLAPSRVFHIATVSKTLSPGLRTAFLAAPGPDQAHRLTAALRATSLMGAGLLTGLTTDWIRSGQAAALLSAIRAELLSRQRIAREILGEVSCCAHPAGPHVWLRLPPHWSSADFVTYVRRQGLALVPSDVFTVAGDAPGRARIALGTAADQGALAEALTAVAAALDHKRAQGYHNVV